MSAEIYGLEAGGFIPQNDFNASQTENGGWRATQTFLHLRESFSDEVFRNKFSFGVRATDLDTSRDLYWSRLYLYKVDVRDDGPWAVIVVHFAGYAGFETDPNGTAEPIAPLYMLKGTLTERSIMEHPSVVALSDIQQSLIQKVIDGEYTWDFTNSKLRVFNATQQQIDWFKEVDTQPSAGDATAFVKLAAKGWRTYEAASFTWEKSWESEQGIATSTINNLGKVDTPDGDPPTPTGTRDWKLIDATQELHGQLYRNRLLWMLSEEGGWNADIYDY